MNALDALVQFGQKGMDDGCFAGAHFSCEEHEALSLHHAVGQHGEGLLVGLAQIEKPRRMGQVKRFLGQVVEFGVQRRTPS